MFKLKPLPNKELVHLSFYDADGKLATEYIPREYSALMMKLYSLIFSLRIKNNRPIYYWHMRHFLNLYERKAEDLRFIDHVRTLHEDISLGWREGYHYNKLYKLYGTEYEKLARYIFSSQVEKEPIMHPYTKAYIKMWKLNRDPQWRLTYHGTNLGETIEMLDILDDDGEANSKRFIRNYREAKKRLQSKP